MWELISETTTSGVELGPALQQIGIGILIAVPAYSSLWLLWKRYQATLTEKSELEMLRVTDRDAWIARERELADRTTPLLAQSANVLASVPEQFKEALMQARGSVKADDIERMLQRVEAAAADLARGLGK